MIIFQYLIWFGLVGAAVLNPPVAGLGLLFGYALDDKSFALINISKMIGLPMFITEPVLAVILVRAIIISLAEDRFPDWNIHWRSPWFWFYSVGVINVLLGFLFASPVLVFRDAAIVFYGLVAQMVIVYVKSIRHIQLIYFVVLAGLILRLVLELLTLGFSHESTTFGMYAAFMIIGSLWTLPAWGRFKPVAIAVIMLFVGVMTATEIRTVWVGFFAAYLFTVALHIFLKVSWKHTVLGSAAIFASIFITVLFLKSAKPHRYEIIKNEYFSMFAGKDSPNLMTRVAMWEDAIEEVIPAAGKLFDVFDRKILNPHYYGSETRPVVKRSDEVVKKNRSQYISDDPSATDILMKYERPKPASKPQPGVPASVKPVPVKLAPPSPSQPVLPKPVPAAVSSPVPIQEKPAPEPQPSVSLRERITYKFDQLEAAIERNKTLRLLLGVPFGQRFVPARISMIHHVNRYDPHNSFVAILYRTGVVGLVCFFLIVGAAFLRAFKSMRKTTKPEQKFILGAVMTCVIYHMVHSLTDVTLENPFRGIPFWLLLGLLMVLTSMINKEDRL